MLFLHKTGSVQHQKRWLISGWDNDIIRFYSDVPKNALLLFIYSLCCFNVLMAIFHFYFLNVLYNYYSVHDRLLVNTIVIILWLLFTPSDALTIRDTTLVAHEKAGQNFMALNPINFIKLFVYLWAKSQANLICYAFCKRNFL